MTVKRNAMDLNQFEMSNNSHFSGTTPAGDNGDSINPLLPVPPFCSDDVDTWFRMLEEQFETTQITSDHEKYQILIANLDRSHERLINDEFDAAPATERYAYLKMELIKRLGESDVKRHRQIIENQQMGDRKPSQFYHDLKRLASNLLADNVVLAVWESQLPPRIRNILESVQNSDPESRLHIADSIYEATLESEQMAAANAGQLPMITLPLDQNRGISDIISTFFALTAQQEARFSTYVNDLRKLITKQRSNERRRARVKSGSRTQFYRRLRPRNPPQQDGLCYYHTQFRERARKCSFPCSWNSGSRSSRL